MDRVETRLKKMSNISKWVKRNVSKNAGMWMQDRVDGMWSKYLKERGY